MGVGMDAGTGTGAGVGADTEAEVEEVPSGMWLALADEADAASRSKAAFFFAVFSDVLRCFFWNSEIDIGYYWCM